MISDGLSHHKIQAWSITIYGHLFSYFIFPGNPTIDYLSLDIEGAEYQVLNTIPYDQIDIKVISIETKHGSNVSAHLKKINRLMKQNGYKFWKTISVDDIYVKRDLFHTFMKDELWKNLHNICVSKIWFILKKRFLQYIIALGGTY